MPKNNQDHKSKTTIDHDEIRKWAEERNAKPARVKNTQILRLDFDEPEATLETITWEEFFEVFDENSLAFLYQEKTSDGKISRFFKFVDRDSVDEEEEEGTEGKDDDEDDDDEDE